MRSIIFSPESLASLQNYKSGNQKLLFKLLDLLDEVQKTPFSGLGKPEALKGNLSGCWSRRINDEHRLVYRINENSIEVISCFGHYQ
jgi:toxin YoeB